jgi:hypothetical protein
MRSDRHVTVVTLLALLSLLCPISSRAWHDETHIAIAKVAGYHKWFNATGADMAKLKAGDTERHNHYVNNPPDTVVTPEMVLDQIRKTIRSTKVDTSTER